MKIPREITMIARKLRNNMTQFEIILWSCIKDEKLGVKFLRQKPVYVMKDVDGTDRFIIPDFYCYERKIILEIDGNIHDLPEINYLDRYKEYLLYNLGYRIIRIKNSDIQNNLSIVLKQIRTEL